jgi:hypothetical protein
LMLIIDVTVEKVLQWQTAALKINKKGKRYTKALPSYLFCLKDPRRNSFKIQ